MLQGQLEAKSRNIDAIAGEINILPDSLVFLDDNPAEREIVRQAVRMLRPGGKLLYSTCTFAPCEDEQTIAGCWSSFRRCT